MTPARTRRDAVAPERGALVAVGVLAVAGVVLVGVGVVGLGGVLVVVAVALLLAVAVGPTARPSGAAGDVVVPRPTGADRIALIAADRRLRAAVTDARAFDTTVGPRLTGLATDRLRRRGVDVATDPERARVLLGEPLFALVTGSAASRPRRAPDLAELITRIEAL